MGGFSVAPVPVLLGAATAASVVWVVVAMASDEEERPSLADGQAAELDTEVKWMGVMRFFFLFSAAR